MTGMKIRKPTEAQADRRHRELWDAAIEEYGDKFSLPPEVDRDISEEVRALYVLALSWDGTGSPHRLLQTYGVLPHIIAKIAGEKQQEAKPEKRKDRYAKLIAFSRANTYREFRMEQLVEESGLSSGTIISWARSTGWFRASAERGLWEARNPADDRRADG